MSEWRRLEGKKKGGGGGGGGGEGGLKEGSFIKNSTYLIFSFRFSVSFLRLLLTSSANNTWCEQALGRWELGECGVG